MKKRKCEKIKSQENSFFFSLSLLLKLRTFCEITYRVMCMSLWYDGANCNEREDERCSRELSKKFFSFVFFFFRENKIKMKSWLWSTFARRLQTRQKKNGEIVKKQRLLGNKMLCTFRLFKIDSISLRCLKWNGCSLGYKMRELQSWSC